MPYFRKMICFPLIYVCNPHVNGWLTLGPKPARIALRMLRWSPCPFWLKHGRSERIFSEGCLGFQSFKIMQHECFLIKELEAIIVLHATKSNIKKKIVECVNRHLCSTNKQCKNHLPHWYYSRTHWYYSRTC